MWRVCFWNPRDSRWFCTSWLCQISWQNTECFCPCFWCRVVHVIQFELTADQMVFSHMPAPLVDFTVLFSQTPYRFNEECMCSCRCTMQTRKATVLNCSIVAPSTSAALSMGMFHWDWKRLATTIQTRCLVLCLSKKQLWRACIKSFITEWTRFFGKNVSFAWAADASLPSA